MTVLFSLLPLLFSQMLYYSPVSSPDDLMVEGAVEYDVATTFSNQYEASLVNGNTVESKFKLSFNPSFIKGEVYDQYPSNFFIIDRVENERRNFCDFYGYHYEFTDPPKQENITRIQRKSDTRQILGHECHRYLVYRENSELYEAWVAEDIAINYPSYFHGCALEYTIPCKYGNRIYKANNIIHYDVSDGYFYVFGYEKISREDFKLKVMASR